MQSISVFLYIAKFADFQRKNVDVRRTKGVCQMIDIFFGSSLVKVLSFFIVGYVWQVLGGGLFGTPSPPTILEQPRKSTSWIGLREWETATEGPLYKKAVLLKNSQYSLEAPMLEYLFNKVAGLQTYNFIKKRLQHSHFPVNMAQFLRTPFLNSICKWLLLKSQEISWLNSSWVLI